MEQPLVRPLGDRVFVMPDPMEREVGGVIIPENIREKPRSGLVLAVGIGNVNNDGTRTEPDLGIGDHVLFSQYVGVDVRLAGDTYLVLREGDILGVIDDAEVQRREAVESDALSDASVR
jgi:chaperonin GroES